MKRKYVQVGLGGRSEMFWKAITGKYAATSELVAICDTNPGRLALTRRKLEEKGVSVETFHADEFDRMIKTCQPDAVIVTTKDCHHDDYICRAMEMGCDAITEKPMTTDETKCSRILDTQKKTGKRCTVTFNYRYAPPRTQVKDMLMSGLIGNVISVDFHWMLNTSHGADYFRRWHRNKVNSGGLMVHKATHHFDLVNWWLSSVPEEVFAMGGRHFYRPETADRYGLTQRGERCFGCPESGNCLFFLDLAANPRMKEKYLENEQYDGYFRDRCVFSDQIDIEDTMNLVVKYRGGASMSYSLNAFMPWEGYMVVFNGSRGRIEHKCEESVYVNGDGSVPGALVKEGTWTRVYPHFLPAYEVELWTGSGGHGGADPVMLDYIFDRDNTQPDKYLRAADQRSGAWSIMTGVAANHSMATGKSIRIDDLVPGIADPDYPAMPKPFEPIPKEDIEAIREARKLKKGKV